MHEQFKPIVEEFDDYIAKPKPNGYQSLHTIVRDDNGKPGRNPDPHPGHARPRRARRGGALGLQGGRAAKGYAGVSATGEYDAKIAVLRQLLAWERDLAGNVPNRGLFEDRIYVLTPDAAVIELPQGATPVDFAYAVHTSLGHRCRGAKVDGAMVPLNTPLQNGQTVEISTVKEGRPSRDWLNAELGYLTSNRAKAKVRAWFNAQATHETVARGREAVEKLLAARRQDSHQAGRSGGAAGFSNRPMPCLKWWARTSFRCATSKRCCARPSPCCSRMTSCCSRRRAPTTQPPRAACWWWASIRS